MNPQSNGEIGIKNDAGGDLQGRDSDGIWDSFRWKDGANQRAETIGVSGKAAQKGLYLWLIALMHFHP
ncbi:hypothetical protein ARNL5_03693 [Anaerolineae bacterium]|nr:hypothetical protein ARNL5_03693 [Anaerolineae bacterium]